MGNGERRKFLQLEYLPKTFAVELIESVLTNYHELFRKVRVSSSSFHTGSPYIAVVFTVRAIGTLTPNATPPLRAALQVVMPESGSEPRFGPEPD